MMSIRDKSQIDILRKIKIRAASMLATVTRWRVNDRGMQLRQAPMTSIQAPA